MSLEDLLGRMKDSSGPATSNQQSILLRSFGCLAATLTYLHVQQLTRHKDIKPGNVLIHGSKVYLGDFGIAHNAAATGRMTTSDDTTYDYSYAPPECRHDERRASRKAKSDVFSLSAVFASILRQLSKDEGGIQLGPDDELSYVGFSDTIDHWQEKLLQYSQTSTHPIRSPVAAMTASMLEHERDRRPSSAGVLEMLWNAPDNIRQLLFCQECRQNYGQ